ncbi:hypothetical protein KP509_36G027400 [Ceratopteris richardii]|uniref:Uncharacterized protein n=1 Tax=Ceratopteris richardii TaxID=49495 RepID=A0A8T2QBP1_CERRI|nr:hypothetical protein KP509_36G027400 [Ceratopteris richardii]
MSSSSSSSSSSSGSDSKTSRSGSRKPMRRRSPSPHPHRRRSPSPHPHHHHGHCLFPSHHGHRLHPHPPPHHGHHRGHASPLHRHGSPKSLKKLHRKCLKGDLILHPAFYQRMTYLFAACGADPRNHSQQCCLHYIESEYPPGRLNHCRSLRSPSSGDRGRRRGRRGGVRVTDDGSRQPRGELSVKGDAHSAPETRDQGKTQIRTTVEGSEP